jgi:acyl-CoA synthetase (AMP-forming)/AMP-acid ligase II
MSDTRPAMNIGRLLTDAARRLPDGIAVERGGRRLTWRELNARAGALASSLRRRGIGRGDRVLVHTRDGLPALECAWACFRLGAVWAPTDGRLGPAETARLAASAGAAAMVYDAGLEDHADGARAACPGLGQLVAIGRPRQGEAAYASLVAEGMGAPDRIEEVDRDDPLWLLHDPGLGRPPRSAVLTHGQAALAVAGLLADLLPGLDETDAGLPLAPLGGWAGLHLLALAARGARAVLPDGERPDAAEAWDLVERHGVSHVFATPGAARALVRHPAAGTRARGPLRRFVLCGAPPSREDRARALALLGGALVQCYGPPEVAGGIALLPPHAHAPDADPFAAPCGYPRTGVEIAVMDPAGRRLPERERGEVCVRGAAVLARPGGPAADGAFRDGAFRDGWFRTGDLGHLDERGFLFVGGKVEDVYASGGSSVCPIEIEEAILAHPAIREVAVVGIPDPKWGAAGIAVCVREPGMPCGAEDVLAWIDGRIARYKWPRQVVFWDDLPRSGEGEVVKALIRERLAAKA